MEEQKTDQSAPPVTATEAGQTSQSAARPARSRRLVLRLGILLIVLVAVNVGIIFLLRSRSVPYRLKALRSKARIAMRLGHAADAARSLALAHELAPANTEVALE